MNQIFSYLFPGMMIMFVFFIGQAAFHDLYVERDKKTLDRMITSSVSVNQIMIAKMARCFLLCLICELILMLITYLFLNVGWGNPLIWLPVLVCLNFAMTGVLSLLYGITRTKNEANALCNIFIVFSSVLGGSFMPHEELPPVLQTIGRFTVNYWGVKGFHVSIFDQALSDGVIAMVVLFFIGLTGMAVGAFLIRQHLETGIVS